MIDINFDNYPKHNWDVIYDKSGFFTLKCKDCLYLIRERYTIGNAYIVAGLNGELEHYYSTNVDYEIVRPFLLTCDEVIIKNIIE